MLLRRDRVVVGLADHLEALDVDFEPPRRAAVGARGPGRDDGRFLRQVVGPLELLVADRSLGNHRLDEAGAVAQDEEVDLAARTAIVQPPLDGDLFAGMAADIFDVNVHKVQGRSLLRPPIILLGPTIPRKTPRWAGATPAPTLRGACPFSPAPVSPVQASFAGPRAPPARRAACPRTRSSGPR